MPVDPNHMLIDSHPIADEPLGRVTPEMIQAWRVEDLADINREIAFMRATPNTESLVRLLERERIKIVKENPYGKRAYQKYLYERTQTKTV